MLQEKSCVMKHKLLRLVLRPACILHEMAAFARYRSKRAENSALRENWHFLG